MNFRLKPYLEAAGTPEAVRDEIVASLYPSSFRIGTSILTSTVNGAVLAAVMRSWIPLGWMAVSLAICAFRSYDWWRYQKAPGARTSAEWAYRFVMRNLPFGLWWGASSALLFLTDDPLVMAIAVLATDAQGAGAVCSYPAHPPAALVFILPAMLMFALAGIIHGGAIGYSIAFVELVLLANYFIIIREFFRTAIRGMVLTHEKSALADNLVEAHAALKREGAAKSEFLAHMSHELRTPLNAIIGFADIIGAGIFGPLNNERYEDYLKDIKSSASHLLSIVNEILDMARIEAGKLAIEMAEIDPSYIVRFATKLIEQRAQAKQLNVEVVLDPELADRTIWSDEVRLKQVIINILSNAVKFTPSGGSIRIVAGLKGDKAFFEITDSGAGMTPQDLERAQLPFVQVGNPMLAQEGSGLGLPLSRQLIEKLGGRFEIASKIGIGTTVTVTLPLSREAAGRHLSSAAIH